MNRKSIIFFITLSLFICFLTRSYANYHYEVPQKALEFINNCEFEKARNELYKFQRNQPDNPLVYFYLAQIEEDFNKALWLYKEVEILADSSLASEALFRRAEMVFSTGNLSDAKRLYEYLINKYSESSFSGDALYRLGIITLKEGKPREAVEYFNQSIELDIDGDIRVLAFAGIMESCVELEDWNNALEIAQEVLKEKDEVSAITPRVLEVIALSWLKLGNEENANKFTERLLKNYPYSYQAHAIREEGNRIASETDYSFDSGVIMSDSEETEKTISSGEVNEENARFSIQLGAFEIRNYALRLLRNLKEAGFDARVDMKTVKSTHYFLIRIGYFMTREEADKMLERVIKITGIKGNIVILNE